MDTSTHSGNSTVFLLECRARLHKILQRLNWTQEGVLKNFNTNSLASSLILKKSPKQNILKKDREYPAGCATNNNCVLATRELQNLFQDETLKAPKNFDDLQANFSREQKLQLYKHTIQNTKKLNNNAEEIVADGKQTLGEIIAENKREAKRKKRKFRIAKPTRIEELRDLVGLQMQSLQQFIQNQQQNNNDKSKSTNEKHSHPRNARSCAEHANKKERISSNDWKRQDDCYKSRERKETQHESLAISYDNKKKEVASGKLSTHQERPRESSTHRSDSTQKEYKRPNSSNDQCAFTRKHKRHKTNERESKDYDLLNRKGNTSRDINSRSEKTSDRASKYYNGHRSKRSRSEDLNILNLKTNERETKDYDRHKRKRSTSRDINFRSEKTSDRASKYYNGHRSKRSRSEDLNILNLKTNERESEDYDRHKRKRSTSRDINFRSEKTSDRESKYYNGRSRSKDLNITQQEQCSKNRTTVERKSTEYDHLQRHSKATTNHSHHTKKVKRSRSRSTMRRDLYKSDGGHRKKENHKLKR